jgi:serine/threonine protein kinase/tetratricopeptide (TPR) repeat protein
VTISASSRLGPYEILSPIGAGGMGEVYRARDTRLGREVAIKVLPAALASDPERLKRFEREARSASALNHPNIVTIYDIGSADSVSYIAMELVNGQPLRALLDGPLPVRRLLQIGTQIAEGLAKAHAAGIVHRDLKPENVMVTEDGLVKILDFGLAKLTQPEGSGATATMAPTVSGATEEGVILGTVGYMSPEQATGKSVDYRSDQFSFGSILYEMATGQRAFQRASAPQTLAAIIQEEPEPIATLNPKIPVPVRWIAERCLSKEPRNRYTSTDDLAKELGKVLDHLAEATSGSAPIVEAPAVEASIAVLPFRNMSAEPDAEYFSDGVTEEIINALAQIGALRVASRTSSFAFKGKDTDIRRIGGELGVRSVLEGSVRQAGRRIRITAQLIDVASGYHLWSERYDREMEDVFAVQDEIARAIAQKLEPRLVVPGGALLVAPLTEDVEAYNLYLKGRYFQNLRRPRLAIEQFEAAAIRDPRYAAVYTGIADAYGFWGFYGGIPTWEAFARARAAAEKAQELAPDISGVHLTLGIIEHYYGWDVAKEERELHVAIERNPRSAEGHFWLSLCLACVGRADESLEVARRGIELEPHSANLQAQIGWSFFVRRRFEEAEREFRRAVALDPEAGYPLWSLGLACQETGNVAEAIRAFERGVEATQGNHSLYIALLGGALARAGRTADARRVLAELRERTTREYVPPFDLAVVLTSLGESDGALSALERAYDERNALLWFRVYWPTFDHLRAEPRWQALAEKLARTAPVNFGRE